MKISSPGILYWIKLINLYRLYPLSDAYSNHVHIFVSIPPNIAVREFVQKTKGRSSSGNITDEVINEYINNHTETMSYHRNGLELKELISDTLKYEIFFSICEAVSDFWNALVTVGYSLANKAQSNKTAAMLLAAAAEVVYGGFQGENDVMTAYQNDVLQYSDVSLLTTIFSNLIRGVNVFEDEENPYNLNYSAIVGEICEIYNEHSDLCSKLKEAC